MAITTSRTVDESTPPGSPPEMVEAFVIDLNGIPRGKWIARRNIDKLLTGEMRMPRSTMALDIWGQDVPGTGLLFETGDSDGLCMPVGERLLPMPWRRRPSAQLVMTMLEADRSPFYADSRQILKLMIERLAALGLTPAVAIELEFHLLEGNRNRLRQPVPKPPRSPSSGLRLGYPNAYALEDLGDFESLFASIAEACAAQGVPASAMVAENSPGQYEINLEHVADAPTAADHAILLKRNIKGCAEAFGLSATFMAKPWGDRAGNGMHVHLSLQDSDGRNVFDEGGPEGNALMRWAIGGLIATMGEAALLFAPHANSYRRFMPDSHAPLLATWGYDNRNAAVRIPLASGKATRLEHRVAGADANPYLVLAAILAGAHYGIVHRLEPPAPLVGNQYPGESARLPVSFESSLAAFERAEILPKYLGAQFCRLFGICRRHEQAILARRVTDVEYASYLRTV